MTSSPRVVYGARESLGIGLGATGLAMSIAIGLGFAIFRAYRYTPDQDPWLREQGSRPAGTG